MSDDNYMSAPNAKTLEAFVEGVKLITGKENPDYFMDADHDIIWIFGPNPAIQVNEESEEGKRLDALGFHWDSSNDCWAWFT